MSDFEYRTDDNYNDAESVSESNVQIENTPVQSGQNQREQYHYEDDSYHRSSGNRSYYEEDQGGNGRYSRYNYIPEEPVRGQRKEKKKGSWFTGALKVAGFAVIFGVVAGGAFAGVNAAKEHFFPSASTRIETTTADTSEKNSTDSAASSDSSGTVTAQDVSAVVEQVMPSVVSITGTFQTNDYFGFGTQESEGAGSGFIIAEDGNRLLIATNNHVVADSSSLTVGFVDGSTASATVVGKDSNADLAVISVSSKDISDETAKKIKIATLGDSGSLKVGQPVIAIGNALGYGQSVTTGVLSAKDREVSFTDGTMTLLQTDAAINPGNSGGVLINMKGEVIGINNAKLEDTSVEGMGYAIPISTANSVLNDLMNAESISDEDASFLGIIGKNIDSSYSEALGMPQGIYVSQVVSGSPAEEAGISAGDIITAMEGNTVSTMEGLKEKLAIKKAGTKVTITYKRANQNGEYEEKETKVTLGKASDFKDVTENSQSQDNSSQDQFNDNQNGNSNGNFGNRGNGNSDSYDYYNNGGNSNSGDFDPFYYFFNN